MFLWPSHACSARVSCPALARVATGVPQHVREDGEGHTGAPAEALEQRAEALGRHWAAALTGEHVWRCLLLTLQAPQGANFVALHRMHGRRALFAPADVQPAGVDLDLVPLQIAQLEARGGRPAGSWWRPGGHSGRACARPP